MSYVIKVIPFAPKRYWASGIFCSPSDPTLSAVLRNCPTFTYDTFAYVGMHATDFGLPSSVEHAWMVDQILVKGMISFPSLGILKELNMLPDGYTINVRREVIEELTNLGFGERTNKECAITPLGRRFTPLAITAAASCPITPEILRAAKTSVGKKS